MLHNFCNKIFGGFDTIPISFAVWSQPSLSEVDCLCKATSRSIAWMRGIWSWFSSSRTILFFSVVPSPFFLSLSLSLSLTLSLSLCLYVPPDIHIYMYLYIYIYNYKTYTRNICCRMCSGGAILLRYASQAGRVSFSRSLLNCAWACRM